MDGKSIDIAARRRGHPIRRSLLLALLTIVGLVPASFGPSQAASSTVVSLTLNDGLTSHYLYARPVLKAYGMTGTFYVASGWIDKSFAVLHDLVADRRSLPGRQ